MRGCSGTEDSGPRPRPSAVVPARVDAPDWSVLTHSQSGRAHARVDVPDYNGILVCRERRGAHVRVDVPDLDVELAVRNEVVPMCAWMLLARHARSHRQGVVSTYAWMFRQPARGICRRVSRANVRVDVPSDFASSSDPQDVVPYVRVDGPFAARLLKSIRPRRAYVRVDVPGSDFDDQNDSRVVPTHAWMSRANRALGRARVGRAGKFSPLCADRQSCPRVRVCSAGGAAGRLAQVRHAHVRVDVPATAGPMSWLTVVPTRAWMLRASCWRASVEKSP